MRAFLASVLLAGLVLRSNAECQFFKESCVTNQRCLDDESMFRKLPGKNQRNCVFCYFDGTEPVKLDAFFRQDTKNSGAQNAGCPQLTTGDSHLMVTYLETCEENRNRTSGMSISDKIKNIKAGTWPIPEGNCTSIRHDIEFPILSTKEALDFGSGIRIASSYVNMFDLLGSCGIGEIARTTNYTTDNFTYAQINRINTGTKECNIVNTGMRDIVFDHIVMNNTDCVRSETSGNDKLEGGSCPLSDFAPDSMEVFRLSPMFSFVDPEAVELRYVKFSTDERYRTACPGRALMSADQLNAKKYPPDPVNVDMMCLDYVEDTHALTKHNGTVEPDLEDPNETPAEFVCPEEIPFQISNYCLEPPDETEYPRLSDASFEWPDNTSAIITVNNTNATLFNNTNATLVNKTISMYIRCPAGKTPNPNTRQTKNPTCVPKEDVIEETYPPNGARPIHSCPYGHTPVENPNLPDNPGDNYNSSSDVTSGGGSNMPFLCAPTKFNSIGSRPIDVTLWDFTGRVFFGNNWPDLSTGITFTVLVYGDKVSGNASTTKLRDGEVFEDYFDNTTGSRLGVFLPDRRIALLDSSDFYDLAEDEFNCFDKKKAECPDGDLTFETLIILAVLTALTALHHYLTSKKDDVGCIVTPETKKNR